MVRVLFVCMGNICRSPTAHALFEKSILEQGLVDQFEVDSAGTHDYHLGEPPDRRTQQAALKKGIGMGHLKARQVQAKDIDRFDYIVAMDQKNLEFLHALSNPKHHSKIALLLSYHPNCEFEEVPDPFYGGLRGFDEVFEMVDEATRGLLEVIKNTDLYPK